MYVDIGDYYRKGPHAPFVDEIRLPASASVGLVRTRQPAGSYPDPPLPELSLQIAVGTSRPRNWYDVGTGRQSGRFLPGHMTLAPAGVECSYTLDDAFDLLVVNMPVTAAVDILQPAAAFSGDFGPLHGPMFEEPLILAVTAGL